MDTLEKKLKTEIGKIRMRASERVDLKERVMAFMEYHPMRADVRAATRSSKSLFDTQEFFYIQFKTWKMRSVAGVFLLVLISSVPVSAESAMPGDVLYPVKVRVNEEVRSGLSLSSYGKVAWEARRVERRIAEARLLAKEGRLTNEVETQITDTVKEHAATAQKEIAVLRESDADGATIAQMVIESAFEVQSAVLDTDLGTDQASSTEGEGHIRALALAVKDAQASLDVSEQDTSLSSYERFMAEAEESTTRAHGLKSSIFSSVTTEEAADITRRLEDLDRNIAAARTMYEGSSTSSAIQGLKETLRASEKLILFLTDIDVRKAVSVETLVPKQLTVEERTALLAEAEKRMVTGALDIEARLTLSTDPALNEKVRAGLLEVQKFASTTENGSLDEAEGAAEAGNALVADMLLMTDHLRTPDVSPVLPPDTNGSSTASSTAAKSEDSSEEEKKEPGV